MSDVALGKQEAHCIVLIDYGVPIESNSPPNRDFCRPIATYDCESWTLNKKLQRTIQSSEMMVYRKIVRIYWTSLVLENIINELDLFPSIQRRNFNLNIFLYNFYSFFLFQVNLLTKPFKVILFQLV